jgi:hypothetical protein
VQTFTTRNVREALKTTGDASNRLAMP